MIARNYSANGKIPVKGTLKRFNKLKRFNQNYETIRCRIASIIGRRSSYKAYQLGYDHFDICKHSCKSVANECKKAPSVGEGAFGKFYVNARSLTRRVRGTCW